MVACELKERDVTKCSTICSAVAAASKTETEVDFASIATGDKRVISCSNFHRKKSCMGSKPKPKRDICREKIVAVNLAKKTINAPHDNYSRKCQRYSKRHDNVSLPRQCHTTRCKTSDGNPGGTRTSLDVALS